MKPSRRSQHCHNERRVRVSRPQDETRRGARLSTWELLDSGIRILSPTGQPLFSVVDHRCEVVR